MFHNVSENVAVWKVCRLFHGARAESLLTSGFICTNPAEFWRDHTTFIVLVEYNFTRGFYTLLSRNGFNTPARVSNRVADMGRSSIVFKAEVTEEKTGELLATSLSRHVLVKRTTRRSSKIPDVMRDRLKDVVSGEKPDNFDRLTMKPSSAAIVCHFEVLPSDTDSHKHLNNSSCIRMCHDALSKAKFQGKLRGGTGDIADLNVERMRVTYLSEVGVGEKLNVYVWEDEHKNGLFFFDLRDLSNKSVFQSIMSFYGAPAKL